MRVINGRHLALATALLVGPIGGAAMARAQTSTSEPNPSIWLRQVYDLYHRAEKSETLMAAATYDLVEKRASKSLAALFKKENDCLAEGKGTCALDWDFVIDGQDYKLANVKVGTLVTAGDKGTVTVSFRNIGTPCVNVYEFAREEGVWKVDDILTKSGADAPVRISKLLKDYDYSQ